MAVARSLRGFCSSVMSGRLLLAARNKARKRASTGPSTINAQSFSRLAPPVFVLVFALAMESGRNYPSLLRGSGPRLRLLHADAHIHHPLQGLLAHGLLQ